MRKAEPEREANLSALLGLRERVEDGLDGLEVGEELVLAGLDALVELLELLVRRRPVHHVKERERSKIRAKNKLR